MNKLLLAVIGACTVGLAMIASAAMITIAPIAGPLLVAHEVVSFFSSVFGRQEKADLSKYLVEVLPNGQTVKQALTAALNCDNVDAQTKAEGWCIETGYTEQLSTPIPQEDMWLIPVWKKAAARYQVPWEMLAAIAAARTSYGLRDCKSDTGVGFYNMSTDLWNKYKVDAGYSRVAANGDSCFTVSLPVHYTAPQEGAKSANPYDPVDASFTYARMLHENGVTADTWAYSGGDPGLCDCGVDKLAVSRLPGGTGPGTLDGEVSRWTEGAIGYGVGATPDKQHLLTGGSYSVPAGGLCAGRDVAAGIPRNYLILYQQAAAAHDLGPDGWSYLAAIGLCETSHGQSDLPGVRSGTNSAGAAGPMQFCIQAVPGGCGGSTWAGYGEDSNQNGVTSVYDPRDAIPAAAKMEAADGAPGDWIAALMAYNHDTSYGQGVIAIAAAYRAVAVGFNWQRLLATADDKNAAAYTAYQGASIDDAFSQAIGNAGGGNSYSDCYIAVVHEWYQAIVDNPPINSLSDIGAWKNMPPGTPDTAGRSGPWTMLPLAGPNSGYQWATAPSHLTGTKAMIDLILAVGQVWNQLHPGQPFLVNDINNFDRSSPHESHTSGVDVDIDWPTDMCETGYHQTMGSCDPAFPTSYYQTKGQPLAMQLISLFVAGGASVIGFDDPLALQLFPGVIQAWEGHENHIHVRIGDVSPSNQASALSYPARVLQYGTMLQNENGAGTGSK